jgi:hypothetical protein
MSPDQDQKTRIEFDYAWGWFQYHAAQRLTAFNFFLIIVGLLLVGYAQAIDHHWSPFGIGIGLLGMLVSMGFFALDMRNEELVDRGLDGLRTLELGLGVSFTKRPRSKLLRHRLWLRLIIGAVGFFFFLGGAWAVVGYPSTGDPATVSCRASTVLVLDRPGLDLNLVQRSEEQRDEGGSDHDRGGPGDSLSGYLHVQSIGVGDHKRVKTGRHCGEESIGGG